VRPAGDGARQGPLGAPISLPRELPKLEALCYYLDNARASERPVSTRLVLIDSLHRYCTSEADMRATLQGLQELAERRNVAVLVTARPTRRGVKGSNYRAVTHKRADEVRAAAAVVDDPEDDDRRYLAPVRMNFWKEPQWLPFRIEKGRVQ